MRATPARPTTSRAAAIALTVATAVTIAPPLLAQGAQLPSYLRDRGRGMPTSLFGTYVEKGELLLYPFYEYTKTSVFEYKPSELGQPGEQDYNGSLVENEYLLFLAYGISDRLSFELEGALYSTASFDKAPDDPTAVPAHLEESGLGDVEGQLRWAWRKETAERPELYSFLEVVFPFQRDKFLIGTQDWEAAFGVGIIRGHSWGTITGRLALAYDGEDAQVELGEYGVEYLKRTSPKWRFVAAIEGETDEVSLIGEVQWFFSRRGFLKLNNGFGLTERAPDVAPEVGVVFRFGSTQRPGAGG